MLCFYKMVEAHGGKFGDISIDKKGALVIQIKELIE